jgi:hypothetical protein
MGDDIDNECSQAQQLLTMRNMAYVVGLSLLLTAVAVLLGR